MCPLQLHCISECTLGDVTVKNVQSQNLSFAFTFFLLRTVLKKIKVKIVTCDKNI
jgi:hypothetical protein